MSQSFRLALKSIASSKMRSFLTMLGIIIGVASVIILVSLMQGMTNYISDSFSDLGTDQVSVSVTNTDTRNVDVDTMYEFLDEQQDLFAAMSPMVSVRGTIKNGTESSTTASISGVGEDYLSIQALELSLGRFIQYSDIVSRQKVCVIGSYVAQDLFACLLYTSGKLCNGSRYHIGRAKCIDRLCGAACHQTDLSLIHI